MQFKYIVTVKADKKEGPRAERDTVWQAIVDHLQDEVGEIDLYVEAESDNAEDDAHYTAEIQSAKAYTAAIQRVQGSVWCDKHGAVHERSSNPYDEGPEDRCSKREWRVLWMEPDDDFEDEPTPEINEAVRDAIQASREAVSIEILT